MPCRDRAWPPEGRLRRKPGMPRKGRCRGPSGQKAVPVAGSSGTNYRWKSGHNYVQGMATAVCNVGVSLVVATGSFGDTKAVTAATGLAILQTIVMGWWRWVGA